LTLTTDSFAVSCIGLGWVGLGWVGLGHSVDEFGWVGSPKMDPQSATDNSGATSTVTDSSITDVTRY